MDIDKAFEEFELEEALSRKDQLRLALAKSKFKKSGGKIEVQPPSPATGSKKYRGMYMAAPKTKEDEKMAQDILDYRKKMGKKKMKREELNIEAAFVEEFGLDERKMTDGEKEEREEIVKKMKPKLQSFKDRYGDDAKKVMYATATKQAMEEVEINEVKFEAGKVYHQDFGGGEISYFRADSVLKNNRWKGMTVDEIGGRQQRPKNITADEKTQGWKETPKNEIPKGLKEEVEIDEKKSATGYELYHKTFSDAMQHAYAHAKSKGFIVDPKEIDDKVATGPKKPSSGKTNRYSLKAGRKKVEIQVANLDNKRYELNMYIEAVELEEGKYRGYDIKKQNRKGQHPLIVPSLEIVGANMKDIKRMIDAKIKKNPKLDIEEFELDEAFSMRKGDKRVVDAFYDQKTIKAHGASILTTDGKTLTKTGMGGQDIAKWVNGKIKIVAVSDVKSTEQILRYMKKSIPSGVFEEVEIDEGTWAMPDSQKKYDQLMKLMQKKIPAGKAAKILYNFTGDDALFDAIGKKEKEDKNADVRPMVNHFLELSDVVKYMKKKGIKIEAPFRGSEEVEIDESTEEYAKSLEKIARDRQISILSKSDKTTLLKIAEILAKEKKEEVEEGVTGPTRMDVQKHFDKEKGLLRVRINATEKALKISDMKVDAKGTVQSFKEEVEIDEAEIATSIGSGGTAGLDMGLTYKKKKEDVKKAKALRKQMVGESVQRTTFAGKDVFIVDSETYYNCRLGKKKYGRYEKYVGKGKVGQTIREYGLKYPRRPIILQNGESGPMLFLKYGRS